MAPDIATFSKTMSNGIAMAAVVGTRGCMLAAQDTFISTTYHTERLGPVAALATLKKFLRDDVQAVNARVGLTVKTGLTAAAAAAGLPIVVSVGLGRIVASHHRSSTLYQIREGNQSPCY